MKLYKIKAIKVSHEKKTKKEHQQQFLSLSFPSKKPWNCLLSGLYLSIVAKRLPGSMEGNPPLIPPLLCTMNT